ncbi:MAG: hypothetical protein V3W20_09215 [Candidatus Neomarinimicrobiota bacterium]
MYFYFSLIPILFLLLFIPPLSFGWDEDVISFQDDFEREDSNHIHQGWDEHDPRAELIIPYDPAKGKRNIPYFINATIENGALNIFSNDTSRQPCVYHNLGDVGNSPIVEVNYTYTFKSWLKDISGDFQNQKFLTQMQLGYGEPTTNQAAAGEDFDYMTCKSGDDFPIVNLLHGAPLTPNHKKPGGGLVSTSLDQGGFAYEQGIWDGDVFMGTEYIDEIIVNGTVKVSVNLNRNDDVRTYDLNISGEGLYERDEFEDLVKRNDDYIISDIPFPRGYNSEIYYGFNSIMFQVSHLNADYVNPKLAGEPVILDNIIVTLLGVCGFSVPSTGLDFGERKPDEDTEVERTLQFSNTGNREVVISVIGGDWDNPNDINSVNLNNGENTRFTDNETVRGYDSMTAISTTNLVEVGTLPNNGILDTYWKTKLLLNDSSFEGPIEQTMTFSGSC